LDEDDHDHFRVSFDADTGYVVDVVSMRPSLNQAGEGMTPEQPKPPHQPRPEEEFGLTEQERLFDKVSHERLVEFLADEATTIHRMEESYNNYGSFYLLLK